MRVRLFSPITSALAAVALAATMLATAAPSATADPSPPASAAPFTSSTTPAAGWFLSLVSRGKKAYYGIDASSQTLELVSPTGQRRVLYSGTISRRGNGYLTLVDWSADGRTALLQLQSRSTTQRLLAVDTETAAVRAVDLPKRYGPNLLSPDGNGAIVTRYTRNGAVVARLGFDGTITPVGSSYGRLIATGPTTVAGPTPGRRTQSVDIYSVTSGGIVARFATPGLYCDPVRRWDASRIELTCVSKTSQPALLLLDTTTGALSLPTSAHPKSKKYFGDLDARQLDSGTYVQTSSECGVQIAVQQSDGRLRRVPVAAPSDNVTLVSATASELVIQRGPTCRGKAVRAALSRLDPVTGTETPIVSLAGRESFDRVVAFGEGQASTY